MSQTVHLPSRFIGLDVHKHYLVATGVDVNRKRVLGPQRVPLPRLDSWMRKTLAPHDAVVLEMTTNAFQLHDDLLPHVHSVTIVHPPHVSLITRARVMTDQIASQTLADLHAVGLLTPVWVPPQQVRDLRALLAQRQKMVRFVVQAKNRLQAVLHRYHIQPPAQVNLYAAETRAWWEALPLSALEHVRMQCDLETLAFAQQQVRYLETCLAKQAASDERVPWLVQLPGVGLITALTLLAAIGDISRFPSAKHLVGYAGLGARVHDSGLTRRTGRITKAGRRDIRAAMVEAAHTAGRTHAHWRTELARLEPRLGKNKATVAIARKLLVAVWHVLTKEEADRFADPQQVARKLLQHTYRLGRDLRPDGQSAAEYVRQQLDRLGLGADLTAIRWGKRTIPLPPSRLGTEGD